MRKYTYNAAYGFVRPLSICGKSLASITLSFKLVFLFFLESSGDGQNIRLNNIDPLKWESSCRISRDKRERERGWERNRHREGVRLHSGKRGRLGRNRNRN